MLRAVIFDVDNTLVNFYSFKEETAWAAARAMAAYGAPASTTQIFRKIFSVYDEHSMEYAKTYYEVVKSFGLKINIAERIQQAAIIAHQKTMFEVLRPYPMVRPVLNELRRRGLLLAIVSDAPRNKVWKRLVITKLAREFDVVITHNDTEVPKPEPTPFQAALDELGLDPRACLFVGDDPGRDILGAREIGMHTCLARYGLKQLLKYRDYPDLDKLPKADFEIRRFIGLVFVVERIGLDRELRQMREDYLLSALRRRGREASLLLKSGKEDCKYSLAKIGRRVTRYRRGRTI